MIAFLLWLCTLPLIAGPSETVDALFARYKAPGSPGCAVTV